MAKQKAADILNTPEVDALITAVEEATRATESGVGRFVEPASGTLSRALSRRHHIIFGRRGSGKTSLLLKAKRDLSLERKPVAFVDMEKFKGHSYPDVLISVLVDALASFRKWIDEAGSEPSNKTSWWNRWFGAKPSKPPLKKGHLATVAEALDGLISDLEDLLHKEDNAALNHKWATSDASETTDGADVSIEIKAAKLALKSSDTAKTSSAYEVNEATRRSKIDYLHRRILHIRKILGDLAALANSDAYLMLDDLYHIRRSDQADVLDYFHRIAKGSQIWLKVGTIKHRTEWYRHSDPPTGLKLGDDADEIDLDISLEKFSIARSFLMTVLEGTAKDAKAAQPRGIMADGALDRLVLASGGVTRDFLTIFRRSILAARERGAEHIRGPKVGAEDVNRAAGEHDLAKREELKRDTIDERERLERLFDDVRAFCFGAKVNCFLVESDWQGSLGRDIEELVDLRLIHRVNGRVTISHRIGRLYVAYMLDLSQYAGAHKRHGLKMIEFWTETGKGELRRASHVFYERPATGAASPN